MRGLTNKKGIEMNKRQILDFSVNDTQTKLDEVTQVFKILGDQTRIRILAMIINKECTVNQLADALQQSQSTVSHQLKTLRAFRYVRHRREGQHVLYTCDDGQIIGLLNEAFRYTTIDQLNATANEWMENQRKLDISDQQKDCTDSNEVIDHCPVCDKKIHFGQVAWKAGPELCCSIEHMLTHIKHRGIRADGDS